MQQNTVSAPTPKKALSGGIYYGWIIVTVMALLQFAGGEATFPVLGLFLEPMTKELGWSRASYALPLTVGTILGGFAGIILGPAFDKYGPKWIMISAAAIVGASFTLMGFVHEYWLYFILQVVTRLVTASAFFMVAGIVLPKWFILKRGRASALSGLGGRFGQFFTPIMVTTIIVSMGWRSAWTGLAIMVWVVAIIPVFLFLRKKPEDMGLLPDGLTPQEADAEKARQTNADSNPKATGRRIVSEVSFTRKEALRTRAFYLMVLAQCIMSLVVSGLHFHWFAYMTGQGLSAGVAVASISISSLAGIPTSLVAGVLVERIHVRYLLAVTSLGFGVSVVMLLFTSTPFMAYAYGISLGMFSGVMFTMTQVVYANYFGREHLGAIQGMAWPISQLTNASGSLVASLAFDMTGNYTVILWVFAGLTTVTALCWLMATQPKKTAYGTGSFTRG